MLDLTVTQVLKTSLSQPMRLNRDAQLCMRIQRSPPESTSRQPKRYRVWYRSYYPPLVIRLAAATPPSFGNPEICDETLDRLDPERIAPGDMVGIGIHTGNALRGYEIGRIARERGAFVVFGGIHATLYPKKLWNLEQRTAVVKGDGDLIWGEALRDCLNKSPRSRFMKAAGLSPRISAPRGGICCRRTATCGRRCKPFGAARSIARSVRCGEPMVSGRDNARRMSSFEEVVDLRRLGFRFIALADDNFYPVTLTDLKLAERQGDQAQDLLVCRPCARSGLS